MDGDDGEKMIGFCTKKTSQREAEISNQSCDNESTGKMIKFSARDIQA